MLSALTSDTFMKKLVVSAISCHSVESVASRSTSRAHGVQPLNTGRKFEYSPLWWVNVVRCRAVKCWKSTARETDDGSDLTRRAQQPGYARDVCYVTALDQRETSSPEEVSNFSLDSSFAVGQHVHHIQKRRKRHIFKHLGMKFNFRVWVGWKSVVPIQALVKRAKDSVSACKRTSKTHYEALQVRENAPKRDITLVLYLLQSCSWRLIQYKSQIVAGVTNKPNSLHRSIKLVNVFEP